MAFDDTYTYRIKTLISNPRTSAKKVVPFLKSRLMPYYRTLLETFGIYKLSKPYSNHEALIEIFGSKRNGFFVQCGGNDGYGNDPTYYLEKALGWKGIIAEPLPVYKWCKSNRRASKVYNFAVGRFDQRDTIAQFVDCYGMSFVKGSIEKEKEWIEAGERTQGIKAKNIDVTIKPIQDIIDIHANRSAVPKIDLFVADVEGYEINAIQGLDFKKNRPYRILLEIQTVDRFEPINKFLDANGYKLEKTLKEDDYVFIDSMIK